MFATSVADRNDADDQVEHAQECEEADHDAASAEEAIEMGECPDHRIQPAITSRPGARIYGPVS